MHREQNTALFDDAFVTLGLIFGYSHADQRANQAADDTASTRPCQSAHDRAGRYEGPQTWNGQRADAREQPQCSTDHNAGARPGCRAFRSLGMLLVSKVLGSDVIRQQDGNVLASEAGIDKAIYSLFNM